MLLLGSLSLLLDIVLADYGNVTYLAGALLSSGFINGIGTNARFSSPTTCAISEDETYALLPEWNYNVVRKIIISTGSVSLFAGSSSALGGSTNGEGTNARFKNPEALSISPDGSYALVADRLNYQIRKMTTDTATVTTLAGGGSAGTANGIGTNATFQDPFGVCISPNGVFAIVVSYSLLIRYIDLSTVHVSTLAGMVSTPSDTNGVGTNAGFNSPESVSISPDSSYALIADTGNNMIRKIVVSTAQVTTLAGGTSAGYANGFGTNALFRVPGRISISPFGTYALVGDQENNKVRRVMISTGEVSDFVGSLDPGYSDGIGTNVHLRGADGVSISPSGSFALISDTSNHIFRRLDIVIADYGDVSLLAGSYNTTGLANGIGTNAQFSDPIGSAISPDESYALVADWHNHAIRKIVMTTGSVTLFAGSPWGILGTSNGEGTNSRFHHPLAVSFLPDGSSAFVADTSNHRIQKIATTTASVTSFAGSSTIGTTNGIGTSASFDSPYAVTVAPNGIFAISVDFMAQLIRAIEISTVGVTTLAGSADSSSATDGIGTNARFSFARSASIAPDSSFVLIADSNNNAVRKIVMTSAQVTTLAGRYSGYSNGLGSNARFNNPRGLSISPEGSYVLVADRNNNIIRRIAMATGEVSDFVGSSVSSGSANGIGSNAQFWEVQGVVISPSGSFALVTISAMNSFAELTS
jgi:DNA-binding beta-propeller fold protein YncE